MQALRGQVKGMPVHLHPGKHSTAEQSRDGVAASRVRKLPVPGGVCMELDSHGSWCGRGNADIRGSVGSSQP